MALLVPIVRGTSTYHRTHHQNVPRKHSPHDKHKTYPSRPGVKGVPKVEAPLETYLREINETPLLSRDEEIKLAHRIGQGDAQARDHMARANLRLVVNIARSYTGKGLGLQDLIAEGNLGLMRAVEGFDPGMNTKFSTYASYWIKQSITRAVAKTGKTIRIPAYMNELLVKWRRAAVKLQDELGRKPTPEEIAASLDLPKKKLRIIKQAIRIYNAAPVQSVGLYDRSLYEELEDHHATDPSINIITEDNVHIVLDLLDKMDKREAAVLRLRFGLDGEEPKTWKEIGEALGLTRERVRQIGAEAQTKLRERVEKPSIEPNPVVQMTPPAKSVSPVPQPKPNRGRLTLPSPKAITFVNRLDDRSKELVEGILLKHIPMKNFTQRFGIAYPTVSLAYRQAIQKLEKMALESQS